MQNFLDFLRRSIYKGEARYLLTVALLCSAQPALAQSLSPMQQYLQNEAGYAPTAQPQPATPVYPEAAAPGLSPVQQYLQNEAGYAPVAPVAVPVAPSPYAVAQTPQPVPEAAHAGENQINSGLSGMNF